MRKDLSYSFRTLRRSPTFTIVAVLSLALGIGANTAIFSLLNQVVLRSLAVREPERLVLLHTDYSAEGTSSSDNFETVFSNPMYRDLRDRDAAFDGVVARMSSRVALGYQGATDSAVAEMVSGNFFSVLGVGTAAGRALSAGDDGAAGVHPVVVLGHAFWSSRFANNPAIVNQTVTINGHPMTVIGVAAAGFNGVMPGSTPDVYVPISMKRAVTPTWDGLEDRQVRWLNIFARLKPGLSIPQAQAATDVAYRAILETEVAGLGRGASDRDRSEFLNHRVQLRPASQGISGLRRHYEAPLEVLMAMVGLVLAIACANVASLMLARASGRRREIAIRLAMGASRRALVKQLLMEGLVLALAGGALGMLVASWSMRALLQMLPANDAGNWLTDGLDLRLLGFALALSVATGLAFALLPAWQATRPDVAETLKNQAASVASGGHARFRKVIVTAQVALSLLLVVGAGLFSMSLVNLMAVDLGFRSQRLMMFSIDATSNRPGLNQAVTFYESFLERLATAPEVVGAAAADGGPFSGSNRGGNITVEGYRAKENEYTGSAMVAVSPGFFRSMGVRLLAGREFTLRDDANAPKAVVVNEAFVKRYFAGRDPIGRRMMIGGSNKPVLDREIVGVVADTRKEVREPAKETFYYPYAQWDRPTRLTFYIRGAGDENRIATTIRRVAREMDASLPVRNVKPVTVIVRESIYSDRLIAMLSMAFGVLATLLAAIGLYGVVAYAVARRTSEIGLRMALGAVPGDVLLMVLREAGAMAGAGIAIGLAAAVVAGRLVASQLFGVKSADPKILAAAAAVLAVVAVVAALVPGRRAARINPVSALKYE